MLMAAMVSPSMDRVTVTSPPKPLAVPTRVSYSVAGASSAAFTASATALEVKVAPLSTSTSPSCRGRVLPMNCA